MQNNTSNFRPLETSRRLKDLMCAYYRELDEASSNRSARIAWCTSQGPVELLRAMGFLVYFPENHGALLGATRMATELIPYATAVGYSPDICSYLTSDIGAFLTGRTPLTGAYNIPGPPRPDVLVYNNNQCRDVQEWFEFYSRQYEVPILGIRTPRGVGEVSSGIIEAVADQMEKMAEDLAPICGQHLEIENLKDTIRLSKQCTELWKQVLEAAVNRPSPLTFFDACIYIGPAVMLRGTERAITYYLELIDELQDRMRTKTGAIPEERYRLYWERMPIWGKLRFFAETMARMKACVVASTYGHSWVFEALDPEQPFGSMARAYTELFTVRDERSKASFLLKMFEAFGVDGVIYHNSKTCPNCANSQYGMPERLSKKTGIPYLIIDGDLNDLRLFSQEQTLTNLEAFVEMLGQERLE